MTKVTWLKCIQTVMLAIILQMACCSCTDDINNQRLVDEPLSSFAVKVGGKYYYAHIDQEKKVADISGVSYSFTVTDIAVKLGSDVASMTPNSETLLNNLQKTQTVTLTMNDGKTLDYVINFPELKSEDDEYRDGYRLMWKEDFNVNSYDELDKNVWAKIPRGTSNWNKCMSDYEGCYDLRDGCMILRGIVNDVLPEDESPYLTGGISTEGKMGFHMGRIDIRARLQSAQGAWPAFWMLPEGKDVPAYPRGGEIDIMEHLNYDPTVYQTVHSYYTLDLNMPNDPPHYVDSPFNADQFNIFSVEIFEDKLVFLVNDQEMLVYPRIETDLEGQYPFADHPFYLMLDMQLGGSWVGEVNPADLPVEAEVDWVRYYKRVEQPEEK